MHLNNFRLLIGVFAFMAFTKSYGQEIVKHKVVMRTTGSMVLHDNTSVIIYGFAATAFTPFTIPSRTLFANEGDSVIVEALNLSREPHTVHLHGLDVNTRNDGDPMTSFFIDHQETRTYSFRALHAGTYIYHCHFQDVMHLQMGMYGLLIIKAANGENKAWTNGPSFTKEYAYLTSELDKFWHDTYEGGHTNYTKHPKYNPTYFLINGKSKQQLEDSSTSISGAVGDKIYLRLANIGFYYNKFIIPSEFEATVIDSDGRPLPMPLRKDTIEVMPGERYGVMITPAMASSGVIPVEYINMNTYKIEGKESIPFSISDPLSVKNRNQEDAFFSIYPNPSQDYIKLTATSRLPIKRVIILDALGIEIGIPMLINDESEDLIISTQHLAPGIYCLRAFSDEGISQKTFIINR